MFTSYKVKYNININNNELNEIWFYICVINRKEKYSVTWCYGIHPMQVTVE